MIDSDFVKKQIEKEKVRYWDFRYTKLNSANLLLWNKELKQIGESESEGIGVRVLIGNGWGFSASADVGKEGIKNSIKNAVKIAKLLKDVKEEVSLPEIKGIKDEKKILVKKNPEKIAIEEKKKFLLEQNHEIKNEIKSIYLKYQDSVEKTLFLSSKSEVKQEITGVFIAGGITAEQNGKNEEQIFRIAKLGGIEKLKGVQEKLDESVKKTKEFLNADKAKSGKNDVVLSGGITGLFAHEALGHASEADLVLQDSSCLKGLIGERLAEDNVSILDDGTQNDYGEWGSFYFDDEGTKAGKTYIIKKGKLNSYLHSLETASKLKIELTGNGRAETSLYKPIVRMSNTYVEKGEHSFEELLEKIKKGYLLKGFRGGMVDPATGGFQFGAQEAYYVENGEIKKPVRGVGFGGHTLELLQKIKAVEKKYSEDSPGFCGKGGQKVLAGGKNPAIFVKEAVII